MLVQVSAIRMEGDDDVIDEPNRSVRALLTAVARRTVTP
jgi:hypothetical protein